MQPDSQYSLNILCCACQVQHQVQCFWDNHSSSLTLAFELVRKSGSTRFPLFPEYLVLCLSGAASSAMPLGPYSSHVEHLPQVVISWQERDSPT